MGREEGLAAAHRGNAQFRARGERGLLLDRAADGRRPERRGGLGALGALGQSVSEGLVTTYGHSQAERGLLADLGVVPDSSKHLQQSYKFRFWVYAHILVL